MFTLFLAGLSVLSKWKKCFGMCQVELLNGTHQSNINRIFVFALIKYKGQQPFY